MMTKDQRPRLKIPYSTAEKFLEAISAASVLTMFAYLLVRYEALPDLVPAHLSFDGRVTRLESKSNLYSLPVVSLVLYLVMTVLVRWPDKFNYPVAITQDNAFDQYRNARTLLSVIKAIISTFFCIFFFMMLAEPHDAGTRIPYAGLAIAGLPVLILAASLYFCVQSFRRS